MFIPCNTNQPQISSNSTTPAQNWRTPSSAELSGATDITPNLPASDDPFKPYQTELQKIQQEVHAQRQTLKDRCKPLNQENTEPLQKTLITQCLPLLKKFNQETSLAELSKKKTFAFYCNFLDKSIFSHSSIKDILNDVTSPLEEISTPLQQEIFLQALLVKAGIEKRSDIVEYLLKEKAAFFQPDLINDPLIKTTCQSATFFCLDHGLSSKSPTLYQNEKVLDNYLFYIDKTREFFSNEEAKTKYLECIEIFNTNADTFSPKERFIFYSKLLAEPAFDDLSIELIGPFLDRTHPHDKPIFLQALIYKSITTKQFSFLEQAMWWMDININLRIEQNPWDFCSKIMGLCPHLSLDQCFWIEQILLDAIKNGKLPLETSYIDKFYLDFFSHPAVCDDATNAFRRFKSLISLNPNRAVAWNRFLSFQNSLNYHCDSLEAQFASYMTLLQEPLFKTLSFNNLLFFHKNIFDFQKQSIFVQTALYRAITTKQFSLLRKLIVSTGLSEEDSKKKPFAEILTQVINFCPYLSLDQLFLIEETLLTAPPTKKKHIYTFYLALFSHPAFTANPLASNQFSCRLSDAQRTALLSEILDAIDWQAPSLCDEIKKEMNNALIQENSRHQRNARKFSRLNG
jgi:hypothetical protein